MVVREINHPLVKHKIGWLREQSLSHKQVRDLVNELAVLLTYEATQDLPLARVSIEGWAGPHEVDRLSGNEVNIVPILRAGFGMLEGALMCFPNARISIMGFYRDETTLEPVCYLDKMTSCIDTRTALIVDPMLATGGTMNAVISKLKEKGCQDIRAVCLIASPEGVGKVSELHPDVKLTIAAVDECLNDVGYILPGLGDAGDRIFGTK